MLTNLTYSQIMVLAGLKRQRFFEHIRSTAALSENHLLQIIKSPGSYNAHVRAAALRNLMEICHVKVKPGQSFASRRRTVRKHFQI